jgi:hypothetical protein
MHKPKALFWLNIPTKDRTYAEGMQEASARFYDKFGSHPRYLFLRDASDLAPLTEICGMDIILWPALAPYHVVLAASREDFEGKPLPNPHARPPAG